MLSSGVGEGDVMVLGGWSNRAMLSRYGAYAASERAFAAVEARVAALEPWGRSAQGVTTVPARRSAGGGRPLPSTGGARPDPRPRPQTRRSVSGEASAILPSRRRTGSVGA